MRSLLLAAALLAAGSSFASQTVRSGKDWARVFDSPCVSAETLARIPEDMRSLFQKAQGMFNGERFFGCWRKMGNAVYIQWDDGDQGMIPSGEFKDDLEV